jgi:hypothetical protein
MNTQTFKVGEIVIANTTGAKLKAKIVGCAKHITRNPIYMLELANGERLIVPENDISPNVVNERTQAIKFISAMLVIMSIIIICTKV